MGPGRSENAAMTFSRAPNPGSPKIAQNRSHSYTLGRKVGSIYILGVLGKDRTNTYVEAKGTYIGPTWGPLQALRGWKSLHLQLRPHLFGSSGSYLDDRET